VAIQDIAHRVVHFGDGRIISIRQNTERKAASSVSW
jgi:hypothetical protein